MKLLLVVAAAIAAYLPFTDSAAEQLRGEAQGRKHQVAAAAALLNSPSSAAKCLRCKGTGWDGAHECRACKGTGKF